MDRNKGKGQYQRRVVGRNTCRQAGIRSFDDTPETPPEIQLPGSVETQAIGAEFSIGSLDHLWWQIGNGLRVFAQLNTVGRKPCRADLRIQSAPGDTQVDVSLVNAQAGDFECLILLKGSLNQRFQNRVVEILPPIAVIAGLRAQCRICSLESAFRRWRFRLLEIRSHCGTAAQ